MALPLLVAGIGLDHALAQCQTVTVGLKRSGKVSRSLEELLIESEKEGVLIPAERAEENEGDAAT